MFKLERLDPRGVDLEQGCQVAHNARPIEVGLCGKTPTVFEFRAETGRVRVFVLKALFPSAKGSGFRAQGLGVLGLGLPRQGFSKLSGLGAEG